MTKQPSSPKPCSTNSFPAGDHTLQIGFRRQYAGVEEEMMDLREEGGSPEHSVESGQLFAVICGGSPSSQSNLGDAPRAHPTLRAGDAFDLGGTRFRDFQGATDLAFLGETCFRIRHSPADMRDSTSAMVLIAGGRVAVLA
jgi:hypothetical protein